MIPDTVIVSIGGICTFRVNFTSPVTLSKTSLFSFSWRDLIATFREIIPLCHFLLANLNSSSVIRLIISSIWIVPMVTGTDFEYSLSGITSIRTSRSNAFTFGICNLTST